MGLFYPRGVAISAFSFRLLNKSTGSPVTSGTVTVRVSKDDGAQALATNAATHNGNGEWLITITAAERDAGTTKLIIDHDDAVPMHFVITSDATLGPGAKQVSLAFGSLGKNASVWVTYAGEVEPVVASGETDSSGNLILYLDAGSYDLYFQKPGIVFTNPYSLVVSSTVSLSLASSLSEASAALAATAYASISEATNYLNTRLRISAWTNASDSDKQKALVMATRSINRLAFYGKPTEAALALGNQFPRGTDTEVPDEIVWACCEEALALLKQETEDAYLGLRVTEEKFSGAFVKYNTDRQPAHILSGIQSIEAWNYLTLYLRDGSAFIYHRV